MTPAEVLAAALPDYGLEPLGHRECVRYCRHCRPSRHASAHVVCWTNGDA